MILIAARARICDRDGDGCSLAIVDLTAAVVGHGDGASAIRALVHPVGAQGGDVRAVAVVVPAGALVAVLGVIGCDAVVAEKTEVRDRWRGLEPSEREGKGWDRRDLLSTLGKGSVQRAGCSRAG